MAKDTNPLKSGISVTASEGKKSSSELAHDFYIKQGAAWVARQFMMSPVWQSVSRTFHDHELEQYNKLAPILALAGVVSGVLLSEIERKAIAEESKTEYFEAYKHAFHTTMPKEMSIVSKSVNDAIVTYYSKLDEGVTEENALKIAMEEFQKRLMSNGLKISLKDLLNFSMDQTNVGLFALKKTALQLLIAPALTVLNELYKEFGVAKSKKDLVEIAAQAFLKGIDASLFNMTSFAEPRLSREKMINITAEKWIKYNQSKGLSDIENEEVYNEWVRRNEDKFLKSQPDLTKRGIIKISFEEVHNYIKLHEEELRKKEILDEAAKIGEGLRDDIVLKTSGVESHASSRGLRRRFR